MASRLQKEELDDRKPYAFLMQMLRLVVNPKRLDPTFLITLFSPPLRIIVHTILAVCAEELSLAILALQANINMNFYSRSGSVTARVGEPEANCVNACQL